ncbi:MAG: glycosyltransferase family 4 protein [Candidatus Sericytochromatia bacterium]
MTRWCFVDASALRYHPGTPEQAPLGGSQSALCWLTRTLAERGHEVTLVNQAPAPGRHHGVTCHAWEKLPAHFWLQQCFDLVISLNAYHPLLTLPLPPHSRRVFWNQHNHLDPAVQGLREAHSQLDSIALVSAWQRNQAISELGLPAGKCKLLRNAPAPAFVSPLLSPTALLAAKAPFPLLAYTSTPGRGLAILLALFPGLKQRFPTLQLQVYSSLQVYQQEEDPYHSLYTECQRLPGVSWRGSISQSQLAEELPRAHCLAYPNIFLETSCIAAMEALAAGCRIVTSDLGALPETTAGWARLVPGGPLREFGLAYFEQLCAELWHWQQDPAEMAQTLLAQQAWIHRQGQWQQRAQDWEKLAHTLLSHGRRA